MALGQPKRGLSVAPPHNGSPRGASVPNVPQPCTKDVHKLNEAITTMMSTLSRLQSSLESQDPQASAPAQETVSPADNRVEEERLAELDCERAQLEARVSELEATAVESGDLEHVVTQLRSRVSQLEARESRVTELRHECRGLRARLAQLITTTMDHKALETEHSELTREFKEYARDDHAPHHAELQESRVEELQSSAKDNSAIVSPPESIGG